MTDEAISPLRRRMIEDMSGHERSLAELPAVSGSRNDGGVR